MPRQVLIVDDDQDTVDWLAVLLDSNSWVVSGANTLASARARISVERFDLIILDSWMPDGDGVDFCRELRSSLPDLPILFLSGAAFPADVRHAVEAGCNSYLIKPCSVNELTQTVKELTSHAVNHKSSSSVC